MIHKIWTTEEIEYIRTHYAIMPNSKLAETLGRSERAIQNYAYCRGLKKDPLYLTELGKNAEQRVTDVRGLFGSIS